VISIFLPYGRRRCYFRRSRFTTVGTGQITPPLPHTKKASPNGLAFLVCGSEAGTWLRGIASVALICPKGHRAPVEVLLSPLPARWVEILPPLPKKYAGPLKGGRRFLCPLIINSISVAGSAIWQLAMCDQASNRAVDDDAQRQRS